MDKSPHSPAIAANTNHKSESMVDASVAEEAGKKPKRTPGLRIFDVMLYPLLTNVGVFAISVFATYLTSRGGEVNAAGKLRFGKTGQWFQNRGDKVKSALTGMGMSEGAADMSKMVAFSFIDGSAMAPAVKFLEDRREHIGRAIDVKLGTCPEDDAIYKAEPKQSWGSVFSGRLATVAVVVPTAVALEKTGLNDKLFSKPGHKLGKYITSKPNVAKLFGHLDIPELSRIGVFEAFYTSVCTAGLYVASRTIAKGLQKKTGQPDNTDEASIATPVVEVNAQPTSQPVLFTQKIHREPKPATLRQQSHVQRISSEPEASFSRV